MNGAASEPGGDSRPQGTGVGRQLQNDTDVVVPDAATAKPARGLTEPRYAYRRLHHVP